MAEIVNLRRIRKFKAREDAAKLAEERRAQFGLSTADKELASARKKLEIRKLDAHRKDE